MVPNVKLCFGNANKGSWRFREKEMENLSDSFIAKSHESVLKVQRWRHDSIDNMNRRGVGVERNGGKGFRRGNMEGNR